MLENIQMAVLFGLMALRWLRGSHPQNGRRSRLTYRFNKIKQQRKNQVVIVNLPFSGIFILTILTLLQTLLVLLIRQKNLQKAEQIGNSYPDTIVVSNRDNPILTFGSLFQHPSEFLSLLLMTIVQIFQVSRLRLRTVAMDCRSQKITIRSIDLFGKSKKTIEFQNVERVEIEAAGRKAFNQDTRHYKLLLVTKGGQRLTAYESSLFALISQQFIKIVAVLELDLELHLEHILQPS